MELLSNLGLGFSVALTPLSLFLAVVGCFMGTIIGALPGLGPSNGVAILIPLSFSLGLDATSALVLLTSVYYGAMYGGRISSILLNIPGDEPALMTTLDGYPMAKAGRAGDALVLSGVASFVGGFFATIGLMVLAPLLARAAYFFGPSEYFALYLLAFTTLGGITSKNTGQGADRGLHRAGYRDDRSGQYHRHATLYLWQSAPDGRRRFPCGDCRPVCHCRSVFLSSKATA